MANAAKKHPKNVAGPWFVDLTCISCDTCTDISPEVFGRDGDRKAFVREQRKEDAALFLFAMESCPVEAVGSEE